MYNTKAYSATSATASLSSTTIPRRDPTERDVQIEILFCGICHSDLHYKRDEWHDVMPAVYPCVPGHEIVGRVTKVGSAVTKYKAGDRLASVASSTPITPARTVRKDWNSSARTRFSPTARRTGTAQHL